MAYMHVGTKYIKRPWDFDNFLEFWCTLLLLLSVAHIEPDSTGGHIWDGETRLERIHFSFSFFIKPMLDWTKTISCTEVSYLFCSLYFCRLLNLLTFDCLIEYCISYFYWIVSFGSDSIWTDHSLQFYQNWPRLPHCHEVKFGRHTCIQCGKLNCAL